MILIFKRINPILKERGVNLILFIKYINYIFKSLKNSFRLLFNINLNKVYIPNFTIKNTIYINPAKIKYISSIPMKFDKTSKFILDFNFDKTYKNLETYEHQTYTTCRQLFIEGKKIEECKNYLFFKDQIKKKLNKNIKCHNDLIKYFENKKKLFENIKSLGVKKSFLFNIQLLIDKNFNLVKINSGNHRFFISRILGLKLIPAEIKLIHLNCFNKNDIKKINISSINKLIRKIEKNYK